MRQEFQLPYVKLQAQSELVYTVNLNLQIRCYICRLLYILFEKHNKFLDVNMYKHKYL